MPDSIRFEYSIGHDAHGRPGKPIGERKSNGAVEWKIESEPTSQRDEGERIFSLTTDQLLRIGEVGEKYQRGGR